MYGMVAMLLPSLTGCWFFATAGRPYDILLGCTGVAMVCWQSVFRGNRRWGRRAVRTRADGCHGRPLPGFLLAFPFAAAETFRMMQRRKFDWRMTVAVCSPVAILAI